LWCMQPKFWANLTQHVFSDVMCSSPCLKVVVHQHVPVRLKIASVYYNHAPLISGTFLPSMHFSNMTSFFFLAYLTYAHDMKYNICCCLSLRHCLTKIRCCSELVVVTTVSSLKVMSSSRAHSCIHLGDRDSLCDARPMVTIPAAGLHEPLAGTALKLYSFVIEARVINYTSYTAGCLVEIWLRTFIVM